MNQQETRKPPDAGWAVPLDHDRFPDLESDMFGEMFQKGVYVNVHGDAFLIQYLFGLDAIGKPLHLHHEF